MHADTLTVLLSWYENLRPATLAQVETLYADDARFKDPFNEVVGNAEILRIYRKMFEKVENPRFKITGKMQENEQAFVTWEFSFRARNSNWRIVGSTHFKFKSEKVVYHRDYWDTGEELWLRLPLSSFILRRYMNKL